MPKDPTVAFANDLLDLIMATRRADVPLPAIAASIAFVVGKTFPPELAFLAANKILEEQGLNLLGVVETREEEETLQ